MKKNFTLLALIMMALSMTFVSCTDDDEYEAYTLEGAWEGDMGVMINGYVANYSTIYFDKNPYQYASGEGYQVDYFGSSSPWRHGNEYYVANHIRWQVYNRVIQLYYVEEDIYAEIRDYSLSSGYFTGYIDFEDGSTITTARRACSMLTLPVLQQRPARRKSSVPQPSSSNCEINAKNG